MTGPVPAPDLKGPAVLFIDDEENILRSLHRLFMDEPFEIFTTTDPDKAMECLATHAVKVIVSDQRMPRLSGAEFLERTKKVRPDAVRILFTGYSDAQAAQDAINKGEIYRYISKPWDDAALKATVRDAIRNHDLAADNRRLFEMTQRQNEELKRAYAEITQLYEKEKAFSSTVSHELRTPLAAIKMAVDLVRIHEADRLGEQSLKFVDLARKNVDRLSRLVNDILGLSKLESGSEAIKRAPDDLNRLVREAAEVQTLTAREKGIELMLRLDPELPPVELDADRVLQVLNNLLNNAIKFTDRGSITVETRDSGDGSVELAVRDTGRGMTAEDLTKIFKKFSQVGDAHERVNGTGLGLAICKEIVERHGGRLWAESETGKGSSFIFRLPHFQEVKK